METDGEEGELEMILKRGDVILVKGKSTIAKIIGWFTKSHYTHAACYVGEQDFIIESDKKGVEYSRLFHKYNGYEWLALRNTEAAPFRINAAASWMEEREGSGYDYLGLVGIGLHLLGIHKGNPWDRKKRYWCSELVADGYINAGVKMDLPHNTWKVAPADFLQMDDFDIVYEHKP